MRQIPNSEGTRAAERSAAVPGKGEQRGKGAGRGSKARKRGKPGLMVRPERGRESGARVQAMGRCGKSGAVPETGGGWAISGNMSGD